MHVVPFGSKKVGDHLTDDEPFVLECNGSRTSILFIQSILVSAPWGDLLGDYSYGCQCKLSEREGKRLWLAWSNQQARVMTEFPETVAVGVLPKGRSPKI